MLTATINVDGPFEVRTLRLESGESFFVIRCNDQASVILSGIDADAVHQARMLARGLERAAHALLESLGADMVMP